MTKFAKTIAQGFRNYEQEMIYLLIYPKHSGHHKRDNMFKKNLFTVNIHKA